jgi:formate-nitrite transporter family protein
MARSGSHANSNSGNPARIRPHVENDSTRPTADEIFENVTDGGRKEIARGSLALAFSGLAAGIGMGLTGLSVAIVLAAIGEGESQQLVARLLYPLGFIVVIIGRSQLFTENTLYPVALCLQERRWANVRETLRLWVVVFFSNVAGAVVFGVMMTRTHALRPQILEQLLHLGKESAEQPAAHLFWSAVVGGWLIALVAWVVSASHYTTGQLAMTWLLTFVVGAGKFAHCIAGSGEILSAAFGARVAGSTYLWWLGIVTAGNILGGVLIVTVLNFGQVHADS